MSTRTTIDPTELLAHGRTLRRIVRAMVRDEHAAEDLVQETYVAALTSRQPIDRVAGWLPAIARNLARRFHRGEGRRQNRERDMAVSHDPRPSSDRTATLLHSLTACVHRLREPVQTVIVMRYFEDRPPREISRTLGLPLRTVKSRLHDGLQELRRRMDQNHGGRAGWLPVLLPLAQSSKVLAPATSVLATAILAVFAFAAWPIALGFLDPEAPQREPGTASAGPAQPDASPPDSEPDRKPLPDAPLTPIAAGRVVAYGSNAPLPSARVRFLAEPARGRGELRRRGRWHTCDTDGCFRIVSRPFPAVRDGSLALEVTAPGRATAILRHEATGNLGTIRLPRGITVRGRVLDEAGAPVRGLRLKCTRRIHMLLGADTTYPPPDERSPLRGYRDGGRDIVSGGYTEQERWFAFLEKGFARTDDRGEFTLPGRWLGPLDRTQDPATFGFQVENLDHHRVLAVDQPARQSTLFLAVRVRRPHALPRISGRLLATDGTPVVGAGIVGTTGDWSHQLVRTDRDGRFTIYRAKGQPDDATVSLTMAVASPDGHSLPDPPRAYRWGETDILLQAKLPTELRIRTAAGSGLDLRRYRCVAELNRPGHELTLICKPLGTMSADSAKFQICREGTWSIRLQPKTDGGPRIDLGSHENPGAGLTLTVPLRRP